MGVYDQIKAGLEEAVAYEQGRGGGKVTKLSVAPVTRYNAEEIKSIRRSTGLTP